ncbi:hypothetical protein TNCV_1477581 [Trichonephila clavipes]|nr:hypothetical protein TNCV_1477581 [Trichonephila clavipes]
MVLKDLGTQMRRDIQSQANINDPEVLMPWLGGIRTPGHPSSLTKFIMRGASYTPVISRSFAHHAGDNTIWLSSPTIEKGKTLGVVRDIPPLFHFHQPHEKV